MLLTTHSAPATPSSRTQQPTQVVPTDSIIGAYTQQPKWQTQASSIAAISAALGLVVNCTIASRRHVRTLRGIWISCQSPQRQSKQISAKPIDVAYRAVRVFEVMG